MQDQVPFVRLTIVSKLIVYTLKNQLPYVSISVAYYWLWPVCFWHLNHKYYKHFKRKLMIIIQVDDRFNYSWIPVIFKFKSYYASVKICGIWWLKLERNFFRNWKWIKYYLDIPGVRAKNHKRYGISNDTRIARRVYTVFVIRLLLIILYKKILFYTRFLRYDAYMHF